MRLYIWSFEVFSYCALNRNKWLKFDELGKEILSIALPAALALAADPLASLIDTAFVGHIGTSVEMCFKIRL